MNRSLCLVLLFFIVTCGAKKEQPTGANTGEKPALAVVNYPLYYFAKSIGGDHVRVYLPAIEGDPAYWKPNARQMSNFQNADLILANGAGYANWMEKVSLPSSRIVITSRGFKDQWIATDAGTTHSHGPEGEHVHKGTAFTTWLNFKFALVQAEAVYQSIQILQPDKQEILSNNFISLRKKLKDLDEQLSRLVADVSDKQLIICSHPVYQYVEAGYGLHAMSLHWEPDEMPDEEQWSNLRDIMKSYESTAMIWEAEPEPIIKARLADMGIDYVVFDPCANRPAQGDFITVMEENINRFGRMVQGLKK